MKSLVFTTKGMRFTPYDPAFVRDWATTQLGVTDNDILARITAAYETWCDERVHEVHVATDPKAEGASHCVLFNAGRSSVVAVGLNTVYAHMVMRHQNVESPALRSLSALELATRFLSPNFGNSKEGHNKGGYLHGGSNYPEFWNQKLQMIENHAIRSAADQLGEKMAFIIDDVAAGAKLWDLPEERRAIYERMIRHAYRYEHRKIHHASRAFLGTLDQGALRAMWKARFVDTLAYQWLTGAQPPDMRGFRDKPVKAAPVEIRKMRQNALSAMPILASLMVHQNWEGHAFTCAIDSGKTLIDAVREARSDRLHDTVEDDGDALFNREMLTWVGQKNHRHLDGFRQVSGPRMYGFYGDLGWVGALPREWRPENKKEFNILYNIRHGVNDLAMVTGGKRTEMLIDFLKACRNPAGLPQGFLSGDIKNYTFYGLLAQVKACERLSVEDSTADFFNRTADQIILPEIFRRVADIGAGYVRQLGADFADDRDSNFMLSRVRPAMFKGMSVVKVLSLSDRWHKHAHRLETRTGKFDKPAVWAPLFKTKTLTNGVRAKCLTTADMLLQEGRRMSHCVGGYTYQCVAGTSHIVTLSRDDWSTTMELCEAMVGEGEASRRGVVLVQHKGFKNDTDLPQAAIEAQEAVIKIVNKGSPNWERIDAMREAYKHEKLLLRIGFDYNDTAACDAAYEAWHGTMRDLFPEPTRAAYLERTGIAADIGRRLVQQLKAA